MKIKMLLAVILLTVSAFAGTFTSTAGRFSADFVTTPTTETREAKLAKGGSVTVMTFFAVAADKSLGELVEYADLSETPTNQDLIDTAKAAFGDRTLDGLGKTESQGLTWTLAAGHDDELLYFYGITCVGTRLYEVTIAVPSKKADKASEQAAEDFLGSIKITD